MSKVKVKTPASAKKSKDLKSPLSVLRRGEVNPPDPNIHKEDPTEEPSLRRIHSAEDEHHDEHKLVLFNDDWLKLKTKDFEFMKKRFSQLSNWKKRKHVFRESILRNLLNTEVNKTYSLRGFYHLFVLSLLYFFVTHPVINYRNTGVVFHDTFFHTFQNDFLLVILTWPGFTIWSFWAFFNQKLYANKIIPTWVMELIQHISQTSLLIMSVSLVLFKDWGISHTAFVLFQAIIHYMKMHSYNEVNYQFRQESEECRKRGINPGSEYPNNINLGDFWFYLVAPVLVYELDFPKYPTRNWKYIIEKIVLSLLSLISIYILVGEYFLPVLSLGKSITTFEAVFRICVPSIFLMVWVFFAVWENILNAIAELTRFGDREFYSDWWNSTTFEEFNRNWNKVVHEFLYRHIYLDFLYRWKWSRGGSQFATFFVSAIFHEFIIATISRSFTPWLMGFMMLQIPIFIVTNKLKGTDAGNYFFWWGLVQGFPLIVILNIRDLFTSPIGIIQDYLSVLYHSAK